MLYVNGKEIKLLKKYDYKTNVWQEIKSLSDDNGDEVFHTFSGLIMEYTDENDTSKKLYHYFDSSEIPTTLKIVGQTSDTKKYCVTQPFYSVLSTDTYPLCTDYVGMMKRITYISDSDGRCSTIGSKCFLNASNLTSIVVPKVESVADTILEGCTSIINIDVPSLQTINGTTFRGSYIQQINVGTTNEYFYSSDNGAEEGTEDYYPNSVVYDKKNSTPTSQIVKAIAPVITFLSNDNVTSIGNALTTGRNLKNVYLKNLKTLNQHALLYMAKLENIIIENDSLCSITNGYDDMRLVIVGKNGTQLNTILSKVTKLSNDNITSVLASNNPTAEGMLNKISINNNVLQTYGECIVVDKNTKTLVVAAPKNENLYRVIAEHNDITAVDSFACSFTTTVNKVLSSSSIQKINTDAFGWNSPQTIVFPELTSVESGIFTNCRTNITGEIHISCENLTNTGNGFISRDWQSNASNYMHLSLDIYMPELTSIGIGAFTCYGNSHYEFDKVKNIGDNAFTYNLNLTSFHANQCTSFGTGIFSSGMKVQELCCGAVLSSYWENGKAKSVGLPSGCKCHCKDGEIYIVP